MYDWFVRSNTGVISMGAPKPASQAGRSTAVTNRPIRTKPAPACPECGSQMKLRRPGPRDRWEPFWGCADFPDCRGTRQIMADGSPEEDWSVEDIDA